MTKEQKMVLEFHREFGILVADKPTAQDANTKFLRHNLIEEELHELNIAMCIGDLVEIADAIADLLYVVYGSAVSFGIDLEPVFAEVHRSNMTKIGGTRREDGKWVKPEGYSKADLAPIIAAQIKGEER